MKRKITLLALVLVVVVLATSVLFACNDGANGKYYKYENGVKDENSWIEIKGKKWSDSDGLSGKVKIDGESIVLMEDDIELLPGTIKDGVLYIGWEPTIITFVKDGATPPSNGEGGNTQIGSNEVDNKAKITNIQGGTVDGLVLSLEVAPSVNDVELSGMIETAKNASWSLYQDKTGQTLIPTKYATNLLDGDNFYYIVVTSEDGSLTRTYTLNIYRNFYTNVYFTANNQIQYEALNVLSHTTVNNNAPTVITGYTLVWPVSSYYVTEKNKTFYAEATPNQYIITLDAGEGSVQSNTFTASYERVYALEVPTRTGYTFEGWYKGDTKLTDYTGGCYAPYTFMEDITVTAKYTINNYTLTVLSENETKGTVNAVSGSYAYNSQVTLVATNNVGHTFAGWYLNYQKVSDSPSYTVTIPAENVRYEARWSTYKVYTNTNLSNAGTYTPTQEITAGETVTLTASTNNGYTWLGWYDGETKVSEGTSLTYTFTMGEESKTYTAKWYKINLARNNTSAGTISSLTGIYKIGDIATVTATTNVGYDWLGWYDGETKVSEGTSLTCIFTMGTESKTYTAKWEVSEEMTNFNFTSTTNTCTITGIKDETVKELVVPNYVTSIGNSAFWGCTSLSRVTIGNSVTSIGNSAFRNCTSLSRVTIGNSVTSIGNSAFWGCTSLSSVTIPNSVRSIRNFAFWGCTSLSRVTIGNSVTGIGNDAFYNCNSLSSVTIPNSVTSIGDDAFSYCLKLVEVYNLSSLTIEKGSSSNGYVGYRALDVYTSLDTPSKLSTDSNGYIIHTNGEEKTLIGYTGSETELTLPSGITSINKNAFRNCTSLSSVTIGNSVESIGDDAFSYCYKLVEVYNLSSLTIEKGSSSNGNVGYYALDVYTSLDTPSKLSTDSNGYIIYINGEEKILVGYVGSETELTLPSGTTSIYQYAFYGCTSLTSVTIPNTVTSIGEYAFYNCNSLSSVTIPDSVKSIGNSAFEDCTSLSSVTIPNSVTSIGNYAFDNCTSLTSVTIPNSVTSIGKRAFYSCYSLSSVTIGNSVTSIGSGAFYHCNSLSSVVIPDSVTSIGSGAFEYCYKLVEVYNLSSLTIKKGSDSNGYVGYYALDVYTSLDTPSKLSTDSNGYIIYINGEEKILVGYVGSETELTLPSGITSINKYAFYNNDTITSVVIPDHVTSIGRSAFYSCGSLNSVTIPNSVTGIGRYAFEYCSGLKTINYKGTSVAWNHISKGDYWNADTGNYTINYNYKIEK